VALKRAVGLFERISPEKGYWVEVSLEDVRKMKL